MKRLRNHFLAMLETELDDDDLRIILEDVMDGTGIKVASVQPSV
jgi:hypothetical protein